MSSSFPKLADLPLSRPLLMIGHGTKNEQGRQAFLDFSQTYQSLDLSRPVIPCFLELTTPTIADGVAECVNQGYTEISALPILLFAARHNKFDVTNELDRCREIYPHIKFYYGRHFGITPEILSLWRDRLEELDSPINNPLQIPRSETVLLFVGRGSSDPDANGDVYKLARILWEGSNYKTVETCFIGITHPRLDMGFERALLYQPKRIIVLPYFLFTGVLVEKIFITSHQQQQLHPEVVIDCLPEMGTQPQLLQTLRDREIESQLGQVQMNCELCKFRLQAISNSNSHHHHDHSHDHHHNHDHPMVDSYAKLEDYHQKIWQAP